MTLLLMLVPLALVAYASLVLPRTGLLTADSVFVYLQLLMLVGTIPLLAPQDVPADATHRWILGYTFLAYVTTSIFLNLVIPVALRSPDRPASILYVPGRKLWSVLILSVVVVLAYFQAVGYSAFIEGLRGLISGSEVDVATLRLESYSGSRYLFPGYVNQFRNALLPALALVVITYWVSARPKKIVRASLVGALAAMGLLGTGQRGSFVIFMVITATYLYLISGRRLKLSKVLAVGLVAVPLFVMSSAVLGRDSPLLDRFIRSNQSASVYGFRYIYDMPIQNGGEWLQSISGILPGSSGSTLASDIFSQVYGGSRGTAPPSLWGGIYHNFGTLGVVIAPIVFALVLTIVTRKGLKEPTRSTFEWVGVAGVFVSLGSWVAGGPIALPNSGLFVFILIWWVGSHIRQEAALDGSLSKRATGRTSNQRITASSNQSGAKNPS